MTAIILLILGIRLALLHPNTSHVLVAATRLRAHRQRCAGFLVLLGRCDRRFRCNRCFSSNRDSDDFFVCP